MQLAKRFRAFYPTGIKGAKCITSGWYRWKTTTKKDLLSYCSNLSHHATASLHVKFDSKVVACCRRTPRTGYEGGKRRSLAFQLVIQQFLAKQVTMFCFSIYGNFTTSSPVRFSSQGKASWGQGW